MYTVIAAFLLMALMAGIVHDEILVFVICVVLAVLPAGVYFYLSESWGFWLALLMCALVLGLFAFVIISSEIDDGKIEFVQTPLLRHRFKKLLYYRDCEEDKTQEFRELFPKVDKMSYLFSEHGYYNEALEFLLLKARYGNFVDEDYRKLLDIMDFAKISQKVYEDNRERIESIENKGYNMSFEYGRKTSLAHSRSGVLDSERFKARVLS